MRIWISVNDTMNLVMYVLLHSLHTKNCTYICVLLCFVVVQFNPYSTGKPYWYSTSVHLLGSPAPVNQPLEVVSKYEIVMGIYKVRFMTNTKQTRTTYIVYRLYCRVQPRPKLCKACMHCLICSGLVPVSFVSVLLFGSLCYFWQPVRSCNCNVNY